MENLCSLLSGRNPHVIRARVIKQDRDDSNKPPRISLDNGKQRCGTCIERRILPASNVLSCLTDLNLRRAASSVRASHSYDCCYLANLCSPGIAIDLFEGVKVDLMRVQVLGKRWIRCCEVLEARM